MKFTPKHIVSYHGKFYAAGETFEVEPADAEELRQYGDVEPDKEPEDVPPRRGKKKE